MFKSVIVPLDGSECAQKAFAVAVDLAKQHGADVAICSIVDPVMVVGSAPPSPAMDVVLTDMQNEARRNVEDAVERARQAGVAARGEVITGLAFERILDFAKRNAADVIVMGTHGRQGLPRFFMGSVAEMVLRKSTCPVLIVREGAEA